MMRKAFALMLVLLLATASALAEAPTAYTLVPDGVAFDVFFVEGGDILQYGSFGRQAENGRYGDTLMRTKPDGTVVWSLDFPYPPEESGVISQMLTLSDGRYLMIHAPEADDLRGFFINPEDGATTEIQLPYGEQQYFAVDGGLIEADVTPGGDSIYLRWLDLNGIETMRKEYPIEHAEDMHLSLLGTEDGYYVMAQVRPYAKNSESSVLMKITSEGLLQWKQTDDSRYGFGDRLHPDGSGGVLLMGYQGMYDDTISYPYSARRIDAQSNTLWERDIEVGAWMIRYYGEADRGMMMVWETEEVFQTVLLTPDGELQKSKAYEKPAVAEGVVCHISGCATDREGQQWVYYLTVQEIDMYNTKVQSFMQRLDTFSVQEDYE